jgi:hypothetical protein
MRLRSEIHLRGLSWLGPVTDAAAVLGVVLVQHLAATLLDPPSQFLHDFMAGSSSLGSDRRWRVGPPPWAGCFPCSIQE